MTIKRNNQRGRPQEKLPPINGRIRADEVRLIDSEGEQLGVVPFRVALEKAEEVGLDRSIISESIYIAWRSVRPCVRRKAFGNRNEVRVAMAVQVLDVARS